LIHPFNQTLNNKDSEMFFDSITVNLTAVPLHEPLFPDEFPYFLGHLMKCSYLKKLIELIKKIFFCCCLKKKKKEL